MYDIQPLRASGKGDKVKLEMRNLKFGKETERNGDVLCFEFES
jgi:hypothetical protein